MALSYYCHAMVLLVSFFGYLSFALGHVQILTGADNIHLKHLAHKVNSEVEDGTFCQFTETNHGSGRQVGIAEIDSDWAMGLQSATGIVDPFTAQFLPTTLKTHKNRIRSVCSLLTKSSRRHSDTVRDWPGFTDDPEHCQPMDDGSQRTAFVFLESNPHAHFSLGDQSFPVEQGNMMVFDGSIPHETVIQKGVVQMLGPFDARTFRRVGAAAEEGEDAAEDMGLLDQIVAQIREWAVNGLLFVIALPFALVFGFGAFIFSNG